MKQVYEFLPLLNWLYDHVFSKPMEGHAEYGPVVANPNIQHADRVDGQDNRCLAKERAEWTLNCSPKFKLENGEFMYRTNHGLAHAVRTMAYVPAVVEYLREHGEPDIKNKAIQLIDQRDVKKLMLTELFSSVGRDSEIDFHKQPSAYRYYRYKAGELFEQCFRLRFESQQLYPFQYFDCDDEFNVYKKALVALGDPNDTTIVHVILNMAHKLDLYRCRDILSCQMSIESYIRQYSQGPYGKAFHRLVNYAVELISACGDKVLAYDYDYGLNFNYTNSDPRCCIDDIAEVNKPDLACRSETGQWNRPFFFKTVRSDDSKYWHQFLMAITPTPVNRMALPPLRRQPKERYTNKMGSDEHGQLKWQTYDRFKKMPMYPTKELLNSSPVLAMTYADPAKGYEPLPFMQDEVSANELTGVRIEVNAVLINRIMAIDCATWDRAFDSPTYKEAQRMLEDDREEGICCDNLAEVVNNAHTFMHNEILARIQAISAVLIFTDTMQARLRAQARARQINNRRQQLYFERNEQPNDDIESIPILFYMPKNSNRHLNYYSYPERLRDYVTANSLPHLTAYLQAIDEADQQKSFIERQKIGCLHYWSAHGHLKSLNETYLSGFASFETQDAIGYRPVHYAAQNGNNHVLKLLKQKQCDLTALSGDGMSPLEMAGWNNQYHTVTWLADCQASLTGKELGFALWACDRRNRWNRFQELVPKVAPLAVAKQFIELECLDFNDIQPTMLISAGDPPGLQSRQLVRVLVNSMDVDQYSIFCMSPSVVSWLKQSRALNVSELIWLCSRFENKHSAVLFLYHFLGLGWLKATLDFSGRLVDTCIHSSYLNQLLATLPIHERFWFYYVGLGTNYIENHRLPITDLSVFLPQERVILLKNQQLIELLREYLATEAYYSVDSNTFDPDTHLQLKQLQELTTSFPFGHMNFYKFVVDELGYDWLYRSCSPESVICNIIQLIDVMTEEQAFKFISEHIGMNYVISLIKDAPTLNDFLKAFGNRRLLSECERFWQALKGNRDLKKQQYVIKTLLDLMDSSIVLKHLPIQTINSDFVLAVDDLEKLLIDYDSEQQIETVGHLTNACTLKGLLNVIEGTIGGMSPSQRVDLIFYPTVFNKLIDKEVPTLKPDMCQQLIEKATDIERLAQLQQALNRWIDNVSKGSSKFAELFFKEVGTVPLEHLVNKCRRRKNNLKILSLTLRQLIDEFSTMNRLTQKPAAMMQTLQHGFAGLDLARQQTMVNQVCVLTRLCRILHTIEKHYIDQNVDRQQNPYLSAMKARVSQSVMQMASNVAPIDLDQVVTDLKHIRQNASSNDKQKSRCCIGFFESSSMTFAEIFDQYLTSARDNKI